MVCQVFRWPLLPVMLMVVPLSACGNRLDISTVEDRIKADIERQGRRLSLQAVRCPTEVRRQAGALFRCVGELEPEGTFTINVTQQDNQGSVAWEVPNSKVMLNLAKVEEHLQSGLSEVLGQPSLVDCGEAMYRANQPGDQFECRVVGSLTDGRDRIDAIWVKVDTAGNLEWQELRDSRPMTTMPTATESPQSQLPSTAANRSVSSGVSVPTGGANPEPPSVQSLVTGPTGRTIKRPDVPEDKD